MKMNSMASLSPLSFHMSYVLIALVNNSGNTVYVRMNLLGELIGDISAKIEGKKPKNKEEIIQKLDYNNQLLIGLRDNYSPMIDSNPYYYKQRAGYDQTIMAITTGLKQILEDHELLKREDMEAILMPQPTREV